MDDLELERYARHILLPEIGGAGQARIRKARVLVIGAAGGHEVLASLYFGASHVTAVELNPATVELPKADPLPPALLAEFQETIRPVLAQLDRLAAVETLAAAE